VLHVLLLVSVLLCAICSSAQYYTNYQWGLIDLTGYATSGHNMWKLMAGSQTCAQAPIGADGHLWCRNSAGQIYNFDVKNQVWDYQSAMGTVSALAVQDDKDVWSVQNTNIYKWNGSAWTYVTCCSYGPFAAGNDGALVTTDQGAGALWLFVSGAWNEIGTGGYTYGAIADANTICGVKNGQLYEYEPSNSAMVLVSPQPSGTIVGCATGQGSPIFMIWNSAGTVQILDWTHTGGGWSTVTSPVPSSIAATSLAGTFMLDSSGHPYHWSAPVAAYLQGTVTGSWNGCPGPGNICSPSATHTNTFQVTFPHGVAGTKVSSTQCPSCAVNLVGWDGSGGCDLLFGNASDPECRPFYVEANRCNMSGASVPNSGGPPPAPQMSLSFMRKGGTPVYNGPVWDGRRWIGSAAVPTVNSCIIGVPSCADPITLTFIEWGPTQIDVFASMTEATLSYPWKMTQVHLPPPLTGCKQTGLWKYAWAEEAGDFCY